MAIITLKNSFHNTEVRVRGPWKTQAEAWDEIQAAVFRYWPVCAADKKRYNRVVKTLCGMSDCSCGTVR